MSDVDLASHRPTQRDETNQQASTAQAPEIAVARHRGNHALRSDAMERRHVSSGSPYEPIIGFSRAVRAGHHIAVGATAPIWPDGSCDPDPAAQARRCLEIIEAALVEVGATMTDVVRTRMYLVARDDWETIGRVHGAIFGDVRPVSTLVVVSGFIDPRWKVEFEADAIVSE
jgi:enamine deaminase RidA (YjgF/YER057c/UK114 family)